VDTWTSNLQRLIYKRLGGVPCYAKRTNNVGHAGR